jgi:hypothetical protein
MSAPSGKPAEKPAGEPVREAARDDASERAIAIPLPVPESPSVRHLAIETEILDEMKRMNRLLYSITYGPRRYTLAFLSGIVRGLGAALGATVIFALLLATLSRLDTTPLIGNYIRRVHAFIERHEPTAAQTQTNAATPTPTLAP